MSSNQEKGRAKNVSNFTLLRINVSSLNGKYQPSNPALSAAGLGTKEEEAKTRLKAFNDIQAPYIVAANDRKVAFAPIGMLLTRVRRELKASDFPKLAKVEAMINLDSLINKFKGKRAAAIEAKPALTETEEDNTPGDPISVSHISCVQRANTLQQITALLSNISLFTTLMWKTLK